jgi:hypothetical protein
MVKSKFKFKTRQARRFPDQVFEKLEYDDFYFSSRVCLRGPPVIDVMSGNVRVGKVRGSRSRARGLL